MIKLDLIDITGGTQTRVKLNQDTVAEYAEVYREGGKFPPVVVFYDGSTYWLADGFHRYFAAKEAGLEKIAEERIPGTQRDAILYSLKANSTHGLKRTNADKRRAVETLLEDETWAKWSDRKIATTCGVTHPFVAAIRNPEVKAKKAKAKAEQVEQQVATVTTPDPEQEAPEQAELQAEPQAEKPKKKAKPQPQPQEQPEQVDPEPEYTELDAAHEQVQELQKELAVARLGGTEDDKSQAAELIDSLRAEVKTLRESLKAVTLARDTLMNERAEMMRQLAKQRNQLAKAKK